MTYIESIGCYWRIADSALSPAEAALYFALVDLANKPKWRTCFTVGNDVLCTKIGITMKTLCKSRQKLVEVGLISVRKGNRGGLTEYQFLGGNIPPNGAPQIPPNGTPNIPPNGTPNIPPNGAPQIPPQKGDNRGLDKSNPEDIKTERQEDKKTVGAHTPAANGTAESEADAFEGRFVEISRLLLGTAGEIWREEERKKHKVPDFEVAFEQFRGYIIRNALESKIQTQSDFRRWFDWRAKEFLQDYSLKTQQSRRWAASLDKSDPEHWFVIQYGERTPIPVGTPDPPGPGSVWDDILNMWVTQ